MSDIQRTCPRCAALLDVPAAAVGRRTQCPACQHVFDVVAEDNPYSPSAELAPPPPPLAREAAGIIIRTPRPERFVNATWQLFQRTWRPLVAAGTVLLAVNVVTQILALALSLAAQESGKSIFVVMNVGLRVLLGLLTLYLTLSVMQMCLDVARGRDVRFAHVFQLEAKPFALALLGYVLLLLPFFIFSLPAIGIGAATGFDRQAMVLTLVPCGLWMFVVFIIGYLFLWPWPWVLVDRRSGLWACFQLGFQVARVNKLNAFLLLLLSMGLSSAGFCACYIGQIVTLPATILLFTVAFLMMTGQPIVGDIDS